MPDQFVALAGAQKRASDKSIHLETMLLEDINIEIKDAFPSGPSTTVKFRNVSTTDNEKKERRAK